LNRVLFSFPSRLHCWGVLILVLMFQDFSSIAADNLSLKDLGLPKISLWNSDITLRSSVGYRDNPTLSSTTNAQNNPFWSTGGDVIIFRLPTGGWQFNTFASFNYLSYVGLGNTSEVSSEKLGMWMAQLAKDLGDGWKSGVGLSAMYQDQVVDTSVTQTNGSSISEIVGESVAARWFVRKDFRPYWTEWDLQTTRQWLAAPLDSSWQPGTRLAAGRNYGYGSELSLAYQWSYVAFDTREQVTADGYSDPGTHLCFQSQATELTWRHGWDAKKHWQTLTKAGLNWNQDNGVGYFDFWQYQISEQLKYHADTWEISASSGYHYFDFPVQAVSQTDLAKRRKTSVSAALYGEKKLGKHCKIFCNFAYEESHSNTSYDTYGTSTTSLGVEYHF